jgi:cyanide hydratase
MTPVLKKYKAAAVNAEPGWFDLEESVRRTIHWIDEAGKAGCKLIAFPELCKWRKKENDGPFTDKTM